MSETGTWQGKNAEKWGCIFMSTGVLIAVSLLTVVEKHCGGETQEEKD